MRLRPALLALCTALIGGLDVASALPLAGLGDGAGDALSSLLLACGTDGQKTSDMSELIAALQVAHGVCCNQLGEVCDGESEYSLPSSVNGTTTCISPVCARVVKLVADSCAPLLGAKSFAIFAKPFQTTLDQATAACEAATSDATQRYAITDSASSKDIDALTAASSLLTDGMGTGGHGGSVAGQDTATLHQAGSSSVLTLVLEMLWLAPRDTVKVSVDGAAAKLLQGHDLPPMEGRTFRSKPGGEIRVTMVQDPAKAVGMASLFSFRIPCFEDAACGLHGSCAGSICVCTDGYTGSRCEYDPCHGVDCGAHGWCNDGSCVCGTPAYSGDHCETFDPCYGIDCGDHGSCAQGVCKCDAQTHSGDHCEIYNPCYGKVCGPQSHGDCRESDGKCICSHGWSGDMCDVDPCSGYDCGHGTCVDNAQCDCDNGYSGNHCETFDPCLGKDCGHGSCQVVNGIKTRCVCKLYYTGTACDSIQCVDCCGQDASGFFNRCAGAHCERYPDNKCHCCGM